MRACERLGVLAFLCWTGSVPAGDLAPRPFRSGSLTAIAAAREGKPFVLNLWSINCPPCRAELALLAKLAREHPKFDLVLVAADDPDDAGEVQAVLADRGLGAVESWIFDDADAQRLRYEIDSGWYGELPRNYFYDPAHNRISVSGVLKEEQLSAWIAAIERSYARRAPAVRRE